MFFLNFALAVSAYINSSFLKGKLGESGVSPAYILSSLALLFALALLPDLLARHPKSLRSLTILFLAFKIAASFGLIYFGLPAQIILLFALFDSTGYLIRFNFDLYLEHATKNRETGRVRGWFMTIINAAWLMAPLLVGTLVGAEEHYEKIYLLVAVALLPVFYLTLRTRPVRVTNPPGQFFPVLWKVFRHRSNHYREIFLVLTTDFLLNLFYALMVIYLPLHLHSTLGFAWPTVGLILTVMLLPFVLITYPLGWLADTRFGEKEIMTLGFLLAGVATLAIPRLAEAGVWVWSLVLFATRVGAAAIEIMKETYLFKKINAKDVEILSLSRNLLPLAYLLAPFIGSLVLATAGTATIFTVLGAITLLGIVPTLALKDTK